MTYKRIIQITDAALADAMAAEIDYFQITFRKARSGAGDEYVIEGSALQKRNIDTIAESVMDMDRQAAEHRS